jgi:hypothetical protein
MLGDLILQNKGKVSISRVLDSTKEKIENFVEATGMVKGAGNVALNITYWNVHCGKGLYYGEGIGEIICQDGRDIVKVTEYGVGKLHGQKMRWRGSSFYQTSLPSDSNKLSFLHGVVGVFETDVDELGNVNQKVWEWK